MANICLVSGHWSIQNITDERLAPGDSARLRGSTGAEGEMAYIHDVHIPRLKAILEQAGANVTVTDAVFHPDLADEAFDLVIACHYDGGGLGSSCRIARAAQNISGEAAGLADGFVTKWRAVYPSTVQMFDASNNPTAGMLYHYAWWYFRNDAPKVLVELGMNTCQADHDILYMNPDLVVKASATAILEYLGVQSMEDVITVGSYHVGHGFLALWRKRGQIAGDGYPLSEEFDGVAEDGQAVTAQWFERARYEYVKATGQVRLARVGAELKGKLEAAA